jgi:GNAT superfamily N-acetyltransferase
MASVRELHDGETALAARTLLELRPQYESPERVIEVIDRDLRPRGYRLVGSFEDGESDAATVAGFRVVQMLAWGRAVYVDDLVTAAERRGRGHADRVFQWLLEEAARQGCGELHLDSGVVPEREAAHRFYFNHGLRISSYHFQRGL